MKKLITLIMIIGLLVSVNVSYGGKPQGPQVILCPQNHNQQQIQGQVQGQVQGQSQKTDIDISNRNTNSNINLNSNSNKNINENNNENTNVNLNSNEAKAASNAKATSNASAINKGNTNEINIDNTTTIPAPILPVPGFIAPVDKTMLDVSWTTSPFNLGKVDFSINELRRVANPSKFLMFGWYEWDKSFQIEMACWDKAKPQKTVQVYPTGIQVTGFTKMGEAQARAVELYKSERQVAAALCVYAAKQGAKVVILHSFSNPVTKADSAVLGGAGASVTAVGDIVNSAGGFGWTTAEKVYRSYVVAELYR